MRSHRRGVTPATAGPDMEVPLNVTASDPVPLATDEMLVPGAVICGLMWA